MVLPIEPFHWSLITQKYLTKNSIAVLQQLNVHQTQPMPVTITKNYTFLKGCGSQLDEKVKESMLLAMM
jgi:hypothetical protein